MTTAPDLTLKKFSENQASYIRWAIYLTLFVIIYFVFRDAIDVLIYNWNEKEEYSHGWLIPLVTAYLIWQEKDHLERIKPQGSWLGVCVAVFALILFLLGELSTLYVIEQYALVILIFGIVLAMEGSDRFRLIWIPLVMLFFTIPLPTFLYRSLSSELQLISSSLGVGIIRLCDISVNLQGNVIDLGTYQLQVVEACNGLRYLFPLMSLAFICAYFFKGAFWKRVIIFLSSIPITILMNSFRIGMIGVLVEYWGIEMANGFLHDFEGWAIFMLCLGVLILEMWLLAKIPPYPEKLVTTELPKTHDSEPGKTDNNISWPQGLLIGALLVVCGTTVASIDNRSEIIPHRKYFLDFPVSINDWEGKKQVMEKKYRDALQFDDYVMADYRNASKRPVNLYVAYYESQRKGTSIHSPRSCIPGGGWKIQSVSTESINVEGQDIRSNRVIIEKGRIRQLVYYWFDQRGRNLTNEYIVKWYLFWDALTRNRSDGALIRYTTIVTENESLETAEIRIKGFIKTTTPILRDYIPQS